MALEYGRVKEIFISKDSNRAGIYQVTLYLRGKPNVITVDDTVLYHQPTQSNSFSTYNPDKPTMWGPIIEKAWSKMNANYLNSEDGFTFQALRSVLGVPVAFYFTDQMKVTSLEQWKIMKS